MFKKSWKLLAIFAIFSLVAFGQFISAEPSSAASSETFEGIKSVFTESIGPFFRVLFFSESDISGNLFVEKTLFFIIICLLIFLVLGNFPLFKENKPIRVIVTLAVSILATRFMPFGWLNTLIGEYKALAMIMAYLLICSPFLIFAYILHFYLTDSSIMRRFGWILFISIYTSLWFGADSAENSLIFLLVLIAAVLALIFDKSLHNLYKSFHREVEKAELQNDKK
ncbi:MAG TPA: hypothetical protein PLK34_01290 [Candidatus Pacearchaeota archaeon]|nr:hypothetical protein [Candidatus Pacearchaeota archaeon]